MAYEVLNLRQERVAGPFDSREKAEKCITDVKKQYVRTTADHPRPHAAEAIPDRGIVEAQAVKKLNAARKAELKRLPRKFPTSGGVAAKAKALGLDLVRDDDQVSSPELTAWYVEQFSSSNQLKQEQ